MSTEVEIKIKKKIPGEDTGIITKNSFCDVCAPGPHCGVTCYVKDGKIIKVEGTDGHPTNHGLLCPKGQSNRQYIYRKDRIQTPLKRTGKKGSGQFEPIGWDEAYAEIARNLNKVKEKYGASSVAFFSGYNKWYRPFLQRFCYSFGSVNYGTESSSCFTSTIMSWRATTGADFVSADLSKAGLFLGWCYNAFHSMHLMVKGVQMARARGMKSIIVDPRITPAVQQQCDLHLRIKPGTDCALALSLGRELIVNDWVDHEYIEKHVHGYEEYKNYVMDFTPERVETITDVPAKDIRLAARMIHENMPLAINQSGAALVHHANGMQSHRAVMALSALMGTYDRPGGMIPSPLTYAHSMAGFSTHDHDFPFETYPKDAPRPVGGPRFPLWEEIVKEMQANDLARQINEGTPYPVKAVWAHGMNYRMFNGDLEMKKAIANLDFFVDIDLFFTDTAKMADIVLPACSSFERSEFKVYGGGYAQYTEKVIEPLYESKSDTDILVEMANYLDLDDELLKSGAENCVRYMVRDTPVDIDFLKANSQFPQKVEGAEIIPVGEHGFATPTGKFELYSTIIEKHPALDALPTHKDSIDAADESLYPFRLVSGSRLPYALHSRLHDVPWLRSLEPDPLAYINNEDAQEMGILRGDEVEVSTALGFITLKANPSLRIKKGTVHIYHGYREADVNAIIPAAHTDPYSGFPGYNSVRCSVTKKVTS